MPTAIHLPSSLTSWRTLALAAMLAAGSFTANADDITAPITIPLETFTYSGANGTYYKYGIQIAINGGMPQTFEFDTGGEGFYAAWESSSEWWGDSGHETGDKFDKTFGSQISYHGDVVKVDSFAFQSISETPVVVSGTFKVGRADRIEQNGDHLWPGGSTAPVEGNFYGDFGLSLKKGAHGIENVFAQLSYGSSVTGGYVVSTGTYGSSNGTAYVQLGLSAADLSNPNTTWFQMTGTTPNFENSGYPTYGADLINATVTLTKGTETQSFALGLNLDTGNPTPGIMIQPGSTEEAGLMLFTSTATNGDLYLAEGVTINITGTSGSGPTTLLNFTSSSNYGYDYVYELVRSDGGLTYMNIGAKLFQNFAVTYNLQDGAIGLTPYTVPEPATFALVASVSGGILLLRHRRKGTAIDRKAD